MSIGDLLYSVGDGPVLLAFTLCICLPLFEEVLVNVEVGEEDEHADHEDD